MLLCFISPSCLQYQLAGGWGRQQPGSFQGPGRAANSVGGRQGLRMLGTVCSPLVPACPSLSRFHRRCSVLTASKAFRPPTFLGSLSHKLLWHHWPLQTDRTVVTVRTFVLHLHMGCPLPPSSLHKYCSKPGQEKEDRRGTQPTLQTDGVCRSLLHPVPSSLSPHAVPQVPSIS